MSACLFTAGDVVSLNPAGFLADGKLRYCRFVRRLAGDPNMRTLQKGEVLQLERKGYYVVDEPYGVKGPGRPMVLFAIPDGRAKNMTKGPAAAQ